MQCIGKRGNPLSIYKNENEAHEAAIYTNNKYNLELSPYRCNKCENYHLSPSKTQIIKSNTCKSNYGEFLSEYNTKYNAKEHSQYLKLDHDSELTPYKCNTCKKWHLSPKNRHTPSIICTTCTDGNKKPKELYFTKKGAQIRKTIILKEQKIKLKIYKCPNGDGWHLTKGNIK